MPSAGHSPRKKRRSSIASIAGSNSIKASATSVISSAPKRRSLRPLHPSEALRIAYQRKLDRLITEMAGSTIYFIRAAYRANRPIMAMDDVLPANALRRAIAKLKKRWLARFDKASVKLAEYFSLAAQDRNDKALAKILKDGGFSVRFQQTQAMKDIVTATIQQNVALIKSIPQKYLSDVEGEVMRSIAAGRDLGTLAKSLQKHYGVMRKRAAFISRSQNNLASASMGRARQLEIGVTKATWRHSAAGKVPRKTHVANNGKTYDVAKGWWDPAVKRFIQPGELLGCRCKSISIIPGFSSSSPASIAFATKSAMKRAK